MAVGTVAAVLEKGFGFILPDPEPGREKGEHDLFFHRSSVIADGFDNLRVGQRVRFEQAPDPRNPGRARAVDVEPADTAESA